MAARIAAPVVLLLTLIFLVVLAVPRAARALVLDLGWDGAWAHRADLLAGTAVALLVASIAWAHLLRRFPSRATAPGCLASLLLLTARASPQPSPPPDPPALILPAGEANPPPHRP